MGRLKYWLCPLKNKRGEGSISTGVKVIIAVVIGALILGGLYLLFAGDNGIFSKVTGEVEDMMGYPAITETATGFLVAYYHSNGTQQFLNCTKIVKVDFSEF